ncbi:MAG: flagellar hook-basal body protein [Rhodobacteraceae bacterium]|nr:MAG: flagellar hook-basal body protein [Paracoccaceae bacterium]
MSFYTALTGLNGSSADISATSNNIANVGTTGFKRSRAEFGDIFATSPLQNSSSSIGSGAILKGVKQQFTQGNIASSLNALDLAISGQGFFTLKPSLTSAQTVYTRNGSLNVDNDRYVVDSAGQYLVVYPVNEDGSVTAKDLLSAVPLQLPITSGDPKATSNISLGVNLPATAEVVTTKSEFAGGYNFNPNDPNTFTNSTSITIFDDLGNPTIATMYFVKTQAASTSDPTNKFNTKLVIGDTIIDPDLVSAVDDTGQQIFIDKFGAQTTSVPDDNFFIEGKGSALYKLDDLQQQVPSQSANIKGAQSTFDFGEEGDKLVQVVTDPMQFNATREAGLVTGSNVYWGKNFLTLNVDNGDQPVNIDIRPGQYNAAQLATEVERAINEAYGDDRKIQIVKNVDDDLNINLFKLTADGTSDALDTPITVDLLGSSYVTDIENISLTGASPDFTKEQFLAHAQARINEAMNNYAVKRSDDTLDKATILGVSTQLFGRTVGSAGSILNKTEIVPITHNTINSSNALVNSTKFMVHSYFGNKPELTVYDSQVAAGDNGSGQSAVFNAAENTLTLTLANTTGITANSKIRIAGNFAATETALGNSNLNGREFTVSNVVNATTIQINTTGLGFPDTDFTLTSGVAANTALNLLHTKSTNVEAFFEGAEKVYQDAPINFSSKKIVVREIGTAKHTYTNADVVAKGATAGIFAFSNGSFGGAPSLQTLGLSTGVTTSTDWVDEKNPPIKVNYDTVNQRLSYVVDRTVLGTGTNSNFNSFTIYGSSLATSTNNLGVPSNNDASEVLIRGGEVLYTGTFVADGEEIQLNDKRYGINVNYNSDTKDFTFASGTTGESIAANGALGVTETQKASNIEVGRYLLSTSDGSVVDSTDHFAGNNDLMGVGLTKSDAVFTAGRGIAASSAQVVGAAAKEKLTEVFRLSSIGGENIFNVSINGINGIIEVPPGFYVGSTLAEALQERINQIADPTTGETVGGVVVKYEPNLNNFTFTTGTTGDTSTIKVKGTTRLGLDDVPLGVGNVPKIFNLVQATNADGIALFVDSNGNVVETPPENLVEGYYPLYIDEGELTFDKSGKLVSPKENVHYEKQQEGFSISLDIDFGASTQFAQPFSVLSVDQDGFTSGRLDGLEIDAAGTIRANYTNGQNNPLGKIVLANFNNQNGLKQIGNATYVETAVSGSPQVGEAGAEGFGNILSGSLERSNVDITEELVNLITAQRNFQASAKAIETTTTLTQTIINIRQ